ncbi:hypothetical protein FGK63_06035 [Ruegeria sediminis]|uniref:Uncharacterized protein n=1 Tax=Ruegeria sediminis TaxID=2583820 RepID=A0ABY2X0C2_9RHOB|nr:hypothetical protein FGK63_06035 [Ruegeria sediminis]
MSRAHTVALLKRSGECGEVEIHMVKNRDDGRLGRVPLGYYLGLTQIDPFEGFYPSLMKWVEDA